MRSFFIFGLVLIGSFNFAFANDLQKEIELALKEFPLTIQEIDQYQAEAIKTFKERSVAFKAQPKNQLSFDTTIQQWHKIIETLLAKTTILAHISLITNDAKIKTYARKSAQTLNFLLQEACVDSDALALCLDYANQAVANPSLITPSQRYLLNTMITAVIDGWPEMNNLRLNAIKLQPMFIQQGLTPYTFIKEEGQNKTIPVDGKVTILNWNVCMFNQGLSMLFGGILPWQDRIEKVAAKLQQVDADVICLQEVFSQEAATQLQQFLKNNYNYFYINIGFRVFGFDYNSLGIPSGLFVASKYPLSGTKFISFNDQETPKNRAYGFFTADLESSNTIFARVVSTHLQPGIAEVDFLYREAQLKAILSNLRSNDVTGIPSYLCGDLNIEKGTEEYKKMLANFIYSDFGTDWTCCELRDYWWKANQDAKKFAMLGLDLEWLDYFLLLKSGMKSIPNMATKVISVNNLKDPKTSLSDHQILITTITFNPNWLPIHAESASETNIYKVNDKTKVVTLARRETR